jgi:hypothetical protein
MLLRSELLGCPAAPVSPEKGAGAGGASSSGVHPGSPSKRWVGLWALSTHAACCRAFSKAPLWGWLPQLCGPAWCAASGQSPGLPLAHSTPCHPPHTHTHTHTHPHTRPYPLQPLTEAVPLHRWRRRHPHRGAAHAVALRARPHRRGRLGGLHPGLPHPHAAQDPACPFQGGPPAVERVPPQRLTDTRLFCAATTPPVCAVPPHPPSVSAPFLSLPPRSSSLPSWATFCLCTD